METSAYWVLLHIRHLLMEIHIHVRVRTHKGKISFNPLEDSMRAKVFACFVHCSIPNALHMVSSQEMFVKQVDESLQLKRSGIIVDLVLGWGS